MAKLLNMVKLLILILSISCLIQNIASEKALDVYPFDQYKQDFSSNSIGPMNLSSQEQFKFRVVLDAGDYNSNSGNAFCLCYPSKEDDKESTNTNYHFCQAERGKFYGRVCLNKNDAFMTYWRDAEEGTSASFALSSRTGKVEISIIFENPSDTGDTFQSVILSSESFDPKTVRIKYKHFREKELSDDLHPQPHHYPIGAYSNVPGMVQVYFDDSTYKVLDKNRTTTPEPTPTPTQKLVYVTSPYPEASTKEPVNSGSVLYIVLGVVIGVIVLIILIIVILRCVQGVWLCGLIGRKNRSSEDIPPPESIIAEFNNNELKKSGKSNEKPGGAAENQQQPSSNVPDAVAAGGQEAAAAGQGQQEVVEKETLPPPTMPPPPPPPPATSGGSKEKKPDKPVVSRETKDTTGNVTTDDKSSDGETDGATTGATTNQTTAAPNEKKKKERVPNMLLVATREEDTQSEGQIPSKRKTKVEKNNKEPAPTKNTTVDPATGMATGKPGATTMKTGLKRTEAAKTGLPKSETELVTDQDRQPGTKGVSATQNDKNTENVETRPTQPTRTMATGAAKGTTMAPTQLGTQTTQGGATTAGGKTNFATGVGKTRVTGPTQMPTADTNETQIPTAGTKTKPTQLPTGATQKTGTTQAATGTTQRGTTMATGVTKRGTAPTQARTGTRQTGETQNPEENDVDPTQVGKTTVGGGGSRPSVAGTQMPSDPDADPTQNPTAFTGGEMRTSKTQLGTAGTKTRTTQKQTKRTDA